MNGSAGPVFSDEPPDPLPAPHIEKEPPASAHRDIKR